MAAWMNMLEIHDIISWFQILDVINSIWFHTNRKHFSIKATMLLLQSQLLLVSLDKKKCLKKEFPQVVTRQTLTCGSVEQEALSVVSEDQPIFEPTYTAAPAMHMKTEMTSPGGFSQTSKQSPEPTEPEWVGPGAPNAGKRGEHVNGTRWVRARRGHRRAGSRIIWLESMLVCRVFHILKIFVYRSLPIFPPLIVATALLIFRHHLYKVWADCDGKFGSLCSVF